MEGGNDIKRCMFFFLNSNLIRDYKMNDVLTGMGMKLAFDRNSADFSGMADKIPGKNLYIGGVFHKAWIDTNEEGTEAAAATGVSSWRSSQDGPCSAQSQKFSC